MLPRLLNYQMKKNSLIKKSLISLALCVAVNPVSALKFEIPKELQAQFDAEVAAKTEEPAMSFGDATKSEQDAVSQFATMDAAAAAIEDDSLAADEGRIVGRVIDEETGAPVNGVAVLLEGADVGTITDDNGEYRVQGALAGVYTLSFIKSGYIEANVTDFQVVGGEEKEFAFALPPRPAEMSDDVYELQDFSVTAEEANDMMTKMELKFDSVRTLDVFSHEDFSKFAASDVADAVKRIAGVSVNDGKFPSVRGLNDRYTVTTFNGMPLPSPDPFRKSPQFDIFPSSLLESIVVSKSATPDLDGESTAANFDLITKKLPDEFFLDVSIGAGWHSGSIDDFRTFDKSDRYLIADGASRMNQAPREDPLQDSPDAEFSASSELGSYGETAGPSTSFSVSVGNTFEFANDRRLGVVFAGYHKRETSAILGAEESMGYDFSGADIIEIQQIQLPPFLGGGFVDVPVNTPVAYGDETSYDYEEYEENVKLGGLLGLSYELGEDHRIFTNVFTSRTNDLVVKRNFNGVNSGESITADDDLFLLRERLYFVERTLTLGQLGGEHTFASTFLEPKLRWGYQYAETVQDEPDFRDTTKLLRYSDYTDSSIPESIDGSDTAYNIGSDDNISLSSNSWRYVEETEDSVRADLDLHPRDGLTLSAGGLLRRADRDADIQSYFENRSDGSPSGDNVASDGISTGNFDAANNAIRSDSSAEREIDTYYLSAEAKPFEWLTLVSGYRLEDSLISVDSQTRLNTSDSIARLFRDSDLARSQVPATPNSLVRGAEATILGVPEGFRNTTGDTIEEDLEDRIYLPSFTATIDPTPGVRFNLGYYETINRPSFREITADIFVDIESGDLLAGNPFLESSTAKSYDFRVEFYPAQSELIVPLIEPILTEGDMIGVSLFYKEVDDPIEFLRPTYELVDEIPFNNPEQATAEGIEFEFSKSFSFIEFPVIKDMALGGNISFTTAEVGVSDAEKDSIGSNVNENRDGLDDDRPLTEQPDQIVNLNLTYVHPGWGTRVTLAYNHTAEVLESIGSEASLDSYRGSTERLDLIMSHEFEGGWKVSFAVKNITDEGYETYYEARASAGGDAADKVDRKTVDSVGQEYSVSVSRSF
jgi:hypothetical protein